MASPLEHYVNTVTTLTSQGNFSELSRFILKSSDILNKNTSVLDTVLATLQPSVHSLGVLAVLKARLQNITPNDSNIDTLHATCIEFINVCDARQIKQAPELMADLCFIYTDLLLAGKCPMRGIDVLYTAIMKIQESESHLTSVHCKFVHLCLISKCFKPALKVLDIDYLDICKENNHFDVEHYLLYYYYGGMIYTALKQYKRAQFFFQICISCPAMALSMIMVEAFKKYLLVSLIVDGKVANIPKYSALVFNRQIRNITTAYFKLGQAYATYSPEKLNAAVTKSHETFVRDQNMGLVKQCIQSLYKMNIHRLTKTFITLSLSDVANRVQLSSPQEAQKYILNMIEDGEIHATINQRDGMVVFHENPEKYNSPAMLANIHEQLARCMQLQQQLRENEENIMLNPQYIQKVYGPQEDEGSPLQTNVQSSATFSAM